MSFFVIFKVIKKCKVSAKIIRLTAQDWAVFFNDIRCKIRYIYSIDEGVNGHVLLDMIYVTKLKATKPLSKRLIY